MLDALREATERLRLLTARLKAKRLALPNPGALLRVKYTAFLNPVTSYAASNWRTHQCLQGTLLLLVSINVESKFKDGREHEGDRVEFVVLLPDSRSLWTTGVTDRKDIDSIYEVIDAAQGG